MREASLVPSHGQLAVFKLASVTCCVMGVCSILVRETGIRCCACVAGGDYHAEGPA